MRDLYDGQVCLLMALLQEKQNWTLQTNPLRKNRSTEALVHSSCCWKSADRTALSDIALQHACCR